MFLARRITLAAIVLTAPSAAFADYVVTSDYTYLPIESASFSVEPAPATPQPAEAVEAAPEVAPKLALVRDTEQTTLEEIAAQSADLSIRHTAEGEVDAMVMLSDVLFEYGEADLAPSAIATLGSIAKKLEGVAGLEISGHTDSLGATDLNLTLGQRRADAVKSWLVANSDVGPDAITTVSLGESKPIAANLHDNGTDNPEGRAQNRRVEFSIVE